MAIGTEGKLGKVIGHLQGDQNAGFPSSSRPVVGKRVFCFSSKTVAAIGLYLEYLRHHDSLRTSGLIDRIDRGKNGDSSFGSQRMQQKYIVAIQHEAIH